MRARVFGNACEIDGLGGGGGYGRFWDRCIRVIYYVVGWAEDYRATDDDGAKLILPLWE